MSRPITVEWLRQNCGFELVSRECNDENGQEWIRMTRFRSRGVPVELEFLDGQLWNMHLPARVPWPLPATRAQMRALWFGLTGEALESVNGISPVSIEIALDYLRDHGFEPEANALANRR